MSTTTVDVGSLPADEPPAKDRNAGRPGVGQRYAGVFVLIAILALFTALEPAKFMSYDNVVGVLGNSAILGILAVGLLAPLAAGVFDISIGGTMTLAVVAVAYLFQSTGGSFPVPLAILVVFVGAVGVGLVNSWLVVNRGVEPFIATIGTGSVMVGMSQLLANGTTITNDIPSTFTDFGRWSVGRIPVGVFILLGLCLVAWYVLQYTPFGRHLYATGASREATRLTGIRTTRVLKVAFVVSALAAAIAGVTFAARLGSGPPDIGQGFLIGAYSVAFLGSTIIQPGRFNVGGLIVALLIISFGVNGLQISGLPFWVVETFQGMALLVAVLLGRRKASQTP
ncbi:Ribose ABC transport system permease protein RbsC (TC 3.A.1.2.1) [Patulibacter medicamentivorans]|uniref:Autoinducer 2 import system permease protein LsrD n=1 Tax=Patulibacter medicamentivorans TaxID=1097667 RepID=H0E018_9ACTN|nr:ABC transporter permease [Patulibacter medicamentivorans]EHN12977.1 Ribose ABC transport system permease protein RbsC (TC 3.A.1.2.1) [Patulibacter medicamentivorans]